MLQKRGQQLSLQGGERRAHPSSTPTPWRLRKSVLGCRGRASRDALQEQLPGRTRSPGHQARSGEESKVYVCVLVVWSKGIQSLQEAEDQTGSAV